MEQELREFGLGENEIQAYLALLKAGVSTANRIAELTGLKRSTTYDTLKLLVSKGIVSTHLREGKTYFEAGKPTRLADILQDKQTRIQSIIPQLAKLQESIPARSKVAFFEGKRGVIAILDDVLGTGEEFLFYGSRKKALVAMQKYPENFVKKRVERGLKMRGILAEQDREDPFLRDKSVRRLSDFRFLKAFDEIEFNVFIYGNKVGFMSSEEDLAGIILENPNLVRQQKKVFEQLWRQARK